MFRVWGLGSRAFGFRVSGLRQADLQSLSIMFEPVTSGAGRPMIQEF